MSRRTYRTCLALAFLLGALTAAACVGSPHPAAAALRASSAPAPARLTSGPGRP